jgi:hypothetical protein
MAEFGQKPPFIARLALRLKRSFFDWKLTLVLASGVRLLVPPNFYRIRDPANYANQ